jgi:putative phosphoribosyl transferase
MPTENAIIAEARHAGRATSRAKSPEGVAELVPPVVITAGGARLSGELAIPRGATGVVLFAHGSGSGRQSPRNQFVAKAVREAGVATLLFDLLTGDEDARAAGAVDLRFNVKMLAQRLVAATRWVANQTATQHLGIGYFGSSTGAAAAFAAAAEIGPVIDAVVSRGGRPDLASEALASVEAPTLLLVGERDDIVLELNKLALARLGGEKKLVVVPGATHLFEERGALDKVANLAAKWFRKHLRPR